MNSECNSKHTDNHRYHSSCRYAHKANPKNNQIQQNNEKRGKNMNKASFGRIELEGDDYEKIGRFYYCLYCGKKVIEQKHYHDGGYDGTSYECDCKSANEAMEIRDQRKKLKERLISLKDNPVTQEMLNSLRFQAAVKNAAIQFKQPQSE